MRTIRRRDIPLLLARVVAAGRSAADAASEPHQDEGLSFTNEALHQEIIFSAQIEISNSPGKYFFRPLASARQKAPVPPARSMMTIKS